MFKPAAQLAPTQQSWRELGGDNIWLPYTQMKHAAEPLLAVATEGSRIHLTDGRVLIDGVASWWVACHGYNHPHIMEAMRQQLKAMPHIMFGGINHEPALKLAKRLATLAPGDLNRVFFSDSGSVAVEVALKMAVQYWINKGEQGRSKILYFRNGYHGDTAACMSVCDPKEGLHKIFGNYLAQNICADLPDNDAKTAQLDELLRQNKDVLATAIIEPLVQGAGGMKFHPPETLRRVAELCERHGILLIVDEIFTGFGRTGTMFACEQAGIVPDIMCLGKALTGGAITLAATLARDRVFAAFWDDDRQKALMHGPTYMANPLACAAANASLDLFEREPRLQQVKAMEIHLKSALEPCRRFSKVMDVRVLGAIGVVQFDAHLDYRTVRQHFVDRGLWVRTWTDCIYLTPALSIGIDDLNALTSGVVEVAEML